MPSTAENFSKVKDKVIEYLVLFVLVGASSLTCQSCLFVHAMVSCVCGVEHVGAAWLVVGSNELGGALDNFNFQQTVGITSTFQHVAITWFIMWL